MAELTLPHPFTARPYRPGDASALTALYNAIEKHGGGHPGYVDDEVQAILDATVTDKETDTRLVFTAAGDLVAAGVVASPPPGGFRVDLYGGVQPAWRGHGVGRAVFDWQLGRAREIRGAAGTAEAGTEEAGTAAGAATEWRVEAGAYVDDATATRLFELAGLTPIRYFFEMIAPAKADVAAAAPVPAGLTVVPYEPRYEQALYDAHMEAFSDHWGYQRRTFESWTGFTTRSDTFRPDLSRLTFDGEEIAGYLLTYDDADEDRVYIGQVGTRRPWRRRGLAGALLADVLAGAAAAGKGVAYLSVDADSPTGAVGVYERVGFEVEARSVSYQRTL
jgi:ribosomal protein S18 acetylase RimI-like enzyme